MPEDARRTELASALVAVRARIEAAVAACGRPDTPTLVVVTKRFPASDVEQLERLGVRDVGENKAQELAEKFADLPCRRELTVHFIGQLQTNKAALVAGLADVVHSVDRSKLARALDRHRPEGQAPLDVLVQVSLDGAPGRGGVPLAGLAALADEVAGLAHLRLRGLMAVAPLDEEPDRAFARLREAADGIRRDHPGATWISAGMSGDLEAAVRHGATHLRVGTAILGSRSSLG